MTILDGIIYLIKAQASVSLDTLRKFFWDCFIMDAFIGNYDRHNGNWGFLYDWQTDEALMRKTVEGENELKTSAFRLEERF